MKNLENIALEKFKMSQRYFDKKQLPHQLDQADFISGFNAGAVQAAQTDQATLQKMLDEFILNAQELDALALKEASNSKTPNLDKISFTRGFIIGFTEQGIID
ncbi:hypothetical protein [Microscilla marina]|uniref:Uncharacterized protein n=1 Tax=Microscilla marina ATCC 23134 TaxID=313606 RepID=A1ZER6_MICM2|nr:hypothetical protein [Microscilla marina]EAY31018.1 hypothetical protein M23134_07425 [Microscilla marina ATCC 23134]